MPNKLNEDICIIDHHLKKKNDFKNATCQHLGLKVPTDAPMGRNMRWLTVSPPGQPDFEIVLTRI